MDDVVYSRILDRLREGKLFLRPDSHELRDHARQHMGDLMNYVAALEAGYRTLTGRLEAYRGQAKGKTLGQLVSNQWSDGACLGYAAMALRQGGMNPSQVVGVLELMEELMGTFSQEEAAEFHESMKHGGTTAPAEEAPAC